VTDVPSEQMFLVRKEADGLNVYDDAKPARIAQFVSSGMKNLKGDILKLGKFLGFAPSYGHVFSSPWGVTSPLADCCSRQSSAAA